MRFRFAAPKQQVLVSHGRLFWFFHFLFGFSSFGGFSGARLKGLAFFSGNQLDNGNRRSIARTVSDFCDDRITAMNIAIAIGRLIKQFIGDFFFSDDRKCLTLGMKITTFCQRDQIIGPSFQFFCFNIRCRNTIILEQGSDHISEHRLTMAA